jgi:hypothetical protein
VPGDPENLQDRGDGDEEPDDDEDGARPERDEAFAGVHARSVPRPFRR